ncbi:MAG: transposase [Bdellovibrionales bacterium]|nr:transposase [Bdellovibrionales bacterium]
MEGRPPDGFKNDYDRGKRFKVPIFKRRKLSKAMNLLVRLRDHLEQILSFALRPRVPFTNNQAERDLRMLKVKEKYPDAFAELRWREIFYAFDPLSALFKNKNSTYSTTFISCT